MGLHNHWGWASFGKRDGFEMLALDGALRHFQEQGQLELFSQALQLRLEDVRIFPETEILSVTRLDIGTNHWQFFTLYRYILDIYKRDGFYAATLGLKDAEIHPSDLLYFLQVLSQQTFQHIHKQTITSVLPELIIEVVPQRMHSVQAVKQAVIPFVSDELTEQLAFLQNCLQGKLPKFYRLLATKSKAVYRSVDEAGYEKFSHNPFYRPEIRFELDHVPKAQTYEDKARTSIVKHSVLDAFEKGGEDRWKKGKNGSASQGQGRFFTRVFGKSSKKK